MIIIGEKINGSIPVVAKAIAERDAEFIKARAIAQANAGATFIDCCASVPEAEEVETLNDKIAEFVSSSRNIFIGLLAVVAAVVIVYGAIVIVSLNGTVKALADIDSISYTMTKDSAALTDAELDAKKDSALVSLAKYTEKSFDK